ncbi:hypothetical protein AYO44_00900 [Planctomycetaceae bacterium SCGC AG-212-F19]|nr:hypothetical protein AYO44_00900 [Planctomycetaceae bacterium SCGC AG-212-F19]
MSRLEELLLAWQDQSIAEHDLAELKKLLADAANRAQLAEDFFLTGVILESLRTVPVAKEDIPVGAEDQPIPETAAHRVGPISHEQSLKRRFVSWLTAVAACLLLALGAAFWLGQRPPGPSSPDPCFAAVQQVQGTTYVVSGQEPLRSQQRLLAQAGQVLPLGQGIATVGGDSGAIVNLVDDVRLTLGRDTTVSTSAEAEEQRDGSKVVLEQGGDLLVEVTRSLGKKKMTVVTPLGNVVTETEQTAVHLSDAAGVVVIRGEANFIQKGTGKSIRLKGGQYAATARDGELYASRLFSPEANVWGSFPAGNTESIAVVISPNGQMLAAVTHENFKDFGVRLGPLDSSRPPMELAGARCVAFSPDSTILATGHRGNVILYETATGNQLRALGRTNSKAIFCLAFAPDGKTLAVSRGTPHESGEVELWNLETEKISKGWQEYTALASGGITLAAMKDTIPTSSWRWHVAGVAALAFSPDGQFLASGSSDKTVVVWDMAAKQELTRILMVPALPVRALAFAPDNKTLAIACGPLDGRSRQAGEVKLWDVATGTVRTTLHGHWRSVTSVVYSANGQSLVTGSADATVRFWDATDGREYGMLVKAHKSAIGFEGLAVALSPDGTRLATASFDRTIKLWKTIKEDALPGARAQAGLCPRLPWCWLAP